MTETNARVDDQTIDTALAAVRAASRLTRSAQEAIGADATVTKGDDSPVTTADYGAQAVVCATLTDRLGDFDLVGEEDTGDLADPSRSGLLEAVTSLVRGIRGDDVDPDDVLGWIDRGDADGTTDRYWTLDPIDGTKGFLRQDQYAIALALIEQGEVVLGVLGCPNLANADGSVGATFVGANGRTVVYTGHDAAMRGVKVADPTSLRDARFCESVESGHSDQDLSAEIAAHLGIESEPFRIDSQCKYGAVARGDASIYLRLPTRADYTEKIWDHAAGMFVVEQAGGTVTDVTGRPLDFGHGALLSANSGVVATSGRFHDEVIAAIGTVS